MALLKGTRRVGREFLENQRDGGVLMNNRPIGFFVHHQGRGHARRCEAILAELGDRPVTILSASRDNFGDLDDRVTFIELPDMIGDPSRTAALHDQPTPQAMHCVPMGSNLLRENAGLIARFLTEQDPTLFFVDVSAEWALLSRLCSVPAVSVRMHGERSDVGHTAAYEASAAMVAPFDERLEQEDYPQALRQKTFYSGGLCTTTTDVPGRKKARKALGLPLDRQIVVAVSGGGGSGTPFAPLTMGARALPEALWLTLGKVTTEGHETEFSNLKQLGWVEDTIPYIAAADLVLASAGDNTVHEIARVGRPFLCVPEWRYFGEQFAKAERLDAIGAAHTLPHWPAGLESWAAAARKASEIDLGSQKSLFAPDAGRRIADFLTGLEQRMWSGETNRTRRPRPLEVVV